jgi:hypothetical protein
MIDPVSTTFCDNYIPAPQKLYWKAYLADKVWTTTEAMTFQQEGFTIIKNEVDQLATHLMETYISTNDNAQAAFPSSGTNNTQSSAVANNAITDAFNNIGTGSSNTAPDSTTKK